MLSSQKSDGLEKLELEFISTALPQVKEYTDTPPITLFFGPGEIYRVIGKTVLKEEGFSSKWENWAVKNARVRQKTVLYEDRVKGGAPV